MIELGQLEKQHDEFQKRGVRIVAVSNDDQATASKSQSELPHLLIVSDVGQGLAKAVDVLHPGAAQDGGDTNAPTTILLDRSGQVRWVFRPTSIITRMAPETLLAVIDEKLK